jgi:tol-pal system protein YbgF
MLHVLRILSAVALVGLTTACTPVWTGNQMQEDIEDLKNRQAELDENLAAEKQELTEMVTQARKDVQELDGVLKEATALLQRNSADFGVEMERLRQEVEMLRGKVEELDFRFQKVEQDLKLFKEDVDLRFADGGGAGLPEKPAELYAFAEDAFQQKNYSKARRAAQAFIKQHPKDARADDAVFLLGESFFADNHHVSSVYEYQKILKNYPKSDRRDDATFRIGEAFMALGKCKEAKVFFESVVKDYPESKWRSKSQTHMKSIDRGACP